VRGQHHKRLSLGFSCQSRFSLDVASGDFRTHPFDFNITTRELLLACLREDGAPLWPGAERLQVHRTPEGQEEGLGAGGVYFWHDYPRAAGVLAPGWEARVPDVQAKYRALWARLGAVLRDDHLHKRLVVSNCQANLTEFAASPADFHLRFGLDPDFATRLSDALEAFGARRFRLSLLVRDLPWAIHLHELARLRPDRFDVRFVGPLSLPTSSLVAASSLVSVAEEEPVAEGFAAIFGRYDNGADIFPVHPNVALAVRGDEPLAEVRPFGGGLVFTFAGGLDRVARAVFLEGALSFADHTRWIKR
jgi:hypothetical protein